MNASHIGPMRKSIKGELVVSRRERVWVGKEGVHGKWGGVVHNMTPRLSITIEIRNNTNYTVLYDNKRGHFTHFNHRKDTVLG